MKRALFMIGLVAMTGCTKTVYQTETLPPLTSTTVQTTTVAPLKSTLSVFSDDEIDALVLLDQIYDSPIYSDDSEIIDTMWSVCFALRNGATLEDLSYVMLEASDGDWVVGEFLAALSGAAVNTLCTDQAWKFGI